MDKRYGNLVYKYRSVSILVILFLTIFFTVGFASFSTEFDINKLAANVRIRKDIRITSVVLNNATSNAISHWEGYNVSAIGSGITLPNSDSTVTYNVKVTNIGNVEAMVKEIEGLPSNLEYTLNNYTLKDMLCDDIDSTQCTLGSTTTISVTIGYKAGGYDSSNTTYSVELDFTFAYMSDSVAKIGDTYYESLADAVADVPNNTQTTIILLKNTSDAVVIGSSQNIILDLNNKTLSNSDNANIIASTGTLTITNGVITTDAPDKGAVDNNQNGTLIVDNVLISASVRQAIYNNRGTVTIRGNCQLSSSSTIRAAVQNQRNSTMTIIDGSITSTGYSALVNNGTMTIGTKDGNVSTTAPYIKGINYGLETTNDTNFYDGIIWGQNKSISTPAKVIDIETGYDITSLTDSFDGVVYHGSVISIANTVTFNAAGGTNPEPTRKIANGSAIGELPVPTRNGFDFMGWFTPDDIQATSSMIITDDITLTAQWRRTTAVAMIGTSIYDTLQQAINAAPANTQTTIKLLKDIKENVNIVAAKNIILDLDGHTFRNNSGSAVIETYGTLSILNGTITSNSTNNSIINVQDGNLTISSGEYLATGARQAIYMYGGTVEITGTAHLTSKTNGAYNNMERGTVQNVAGTLTITGGTIESSAQHAVSNFSTLTIGTNDGTVDATSPVLIGKVDGLKSTVAFNYYDGIIKGQSDSIVGTIADQEANTTLVDSTETIGGVVYKTAYLDDNQ